MFDNLADEPLGVATIEFGFAVGNFRAMFGTPLPRVVAEWFDGQIAACEADFDQAEAAYLAGAADYSELYEWLLSRIAERREILRSTMSAPVLIFDEGPQQ